MTRDAATLADQLGVRIFTADIIYHLFDQFTAYLKQVGQEGCATVLHLCLHLCLICIGTGVQLAWLAQRSRGQHSTPGTPGAAARALLRPAQLCVCHMPAVQAVLGDTPPPKHPHTNPHTPIHHRHHPHPTLSHPTPFPFCLPSCPGR